MTVDDLEEKAAAWADHAIDRDLIRANDEMRPLLAMALATSYLVGWIDNAATDDLRAIGVEAVERFDARHNSKKEDN